MLKFLWLCEVLLGCWNLNFLLCLFLRRSRTLELISLADFELVKPAKFSGSCPNLNLHPSSSFSWLHVERARIRTQRSPARSFFNLSYLHVAHSSDVAISVASIALQQKGLLLGLSTILAHLHFDSWHLFHMCDTCTCDVPPKCHLTKLVL